MKTRKIRKKGMVRKMNEYERKIKEEKKEVERE